MLNLDKFQEKELRLLKKCNRHFDSIRLWNKLIVFYLASDMEVCNRPIPFMLKCMNEKRTKQNFVLRKNYNLLLFTLTTLAETESIK